MSISELTNLGPHAYLEKVEATPYPLKEKIIDLVPFFLNFLRETFNGFLHPVKTLVGTCAYLFVHRTNIYQPRFLTPKRIKQYCKEEKSPEGLEKKLLYIIGKTQQLAQKMEIGEVGVCIEDTPELAKSFRGYNIRIIELGRDFIVYSKEEMAAVLAHELSHIKRNDSLKAVIFNWIVLTLNLVTFRHFNFWHALNVLLFTNGAADLIFQAITKRIELATDREAMYWLNSNTGMVEQFHRELKEQYTIKHTPAEKLLKENPTKTIEDIQWAQSFAITPNGNLRSDLVSTTERLAQALNFNPAENGRSSCAGKPVID